ncbi:MarR family transcriptional regulator [Phenylobacterium sp.]|uniref:MarR family winged helix-turn-helix transcriptional regulator n=1 Tax=Phenylobacterium sp. TaxID=1871053 RepID=UPI0025DC9F66|nr:MarR family transcriptional regulator [Phenylobacterium sp.]
MTPPVDLPPGDSFGFQVRRCHRAFDRLLNVYLARKGLTSGFWYFLRALWQENGATQKRLSQLNNVTEPTTVTTLNAMTRIGLVRRERNVADRRKLNVFLTPKAEGLKALLMPDAHEINAIACAGVDPADLAVGLRVLKQMSANLTREAARVSAEGDTA